MLMIVPQITNVKVTGYVVVMDVEGTLVLNLLNCVR